MVVMSGPTSFFLQGKSNCQVFLVFFAGLVAPFI